MRQKRENIPLDFTKKIIMVGFLLGMVLFVTGCAEEKKVNLPTDILSKPLTVLKEESCGCCGEYVQYLTENGFAVTVNEITDMIPIKEKYEIPTAMRSCHTTLVDGYVVEGHVPLEAVEKLLTEKPNINGIALPGMPSGSPGMSGQKEEQFVIYSLNKDGSVAEFMRI